MEPEIELRVLPAAAERVETGPVQFGDDWPGVFIRGDTALMAYLPAIQMALDAINTYGGPAGDGVIHAMMLRELKSLLGSCDARMHPKLPVS